MRVARVRAISKHVKRIRLGNINKILKATISIRNVSQRHVVQLSTIVNKTFFLVQIHYTLTICYMFRLFGHHQILIQCWLHCSPLTLANVQSRYVFWSWFDIFGCSVMSAYALVKIVSMKIVKLLRPFNPKILLL